MLSQVTLGTSPADIDETQHGPGTRPSKPAVRQEARCAAPPSLRDREHVGGASVRSLAIRRAERAGGFSLISSFDGDTGRPLRIRKLGAKVHRPCSGTWWDVTPREGGSGTLGGPGAACKFLAGLMFQVSPRVTVYRTDYVKKFWSCTSCKTAKEMVGFGPTVRLPVQRFSSSRFSCWRVSGSS